MIGDADMYRIDCNDTYGKMLVISYKSIYINTFNVLVISTETGRVANSYERYHLWETSISSILLPSHKFVIISSKGIRAMNFSRKTQ